MNKTIAVLLLGSASVNGIKINHQLRNKIQLSDSDLHVGVAELNAAANDLNQSVEDEFEFTPDNHIRVHIKDPNDPQSLT